MSGFQWSQVIVASPHLDRISVVGVDGSQRHRDARGIAQLLRLGWYRPVHAKSVSAQEVRALLTARRLMQAKLLDIESGIRGLLRGFGLKVGPIRRGRFKVRILELVDGHAMLETVIGAMLAARAPTPFKHSRDVGPHFGLTPKKYQSGELDVTGRITKVGDKMVRTALYEAADVMLTRTVHSSTLKAWGMAVAKRRGMRKARVALAGKLAVVLHRKWIDDTRFRWTNEETAIA